jgi:uncharacterized membrane protein YphA (DoxX/SURF4 family)
VLIDLTANAHGGALQSALSFAFRLIVATVWLVAGVLKLRAPAAATRDSVERVLGISWANAFVARALAPAEVLLGLVLLTGWRYRASAVVSALLFFVFAFLIGRAAIRRSLAEGGCGCFGARTAPRDDGTFSDSIAGRAIARNVVLAILALAAAA